MLLNFTYQELERVECNIKAHIKNKTRIEQNNIKTEDIQVPCNIFLCIISVLFLAYCSFLDKVTWEHISFWGVIFLLFLIVNSPSCASPSSCEETNLAQNLSDEEIRTEILNRLKAQYFCESNINFLNMLYYKDILNKAEKERIDGFLASKGKGILDYLSSLGERELEMFAKPYREQIAIDIEQAVRNYYEIKSKQEKSLLELVKARA